MLIQKEEANGRLYQLSQYSSGYIRGDSPRTRGMRKAAMTEAKRKLNERARLWKVMQLLCANFAEGRDLFVCLTYAEAPENEGRDIEAFHRLTKRAMKRQGAEHTYITFPADHELPGAPVRTHFHLVMRGMEGAGGYAAMCKLIGECWTHGTVDVRPLRQSTEFFEDTARYLLSQPRGKGRRAFSCSRNLKPPAEPIRQRVPETRQVEPPPGVTIIDDVRVENVYGSYRYMVGRIYDEKAFAAYWAKQRQKAAPDPWERLRRRRYASLRCPRGTSPP